MAGIGFELRKLFEEKGGLFKTVKAYFFSALVSVGPWLITIVGLNFFNLLAHQYFRDIAQKDLFMGSIIYAFVFSQILTAPWQMLLVRYISDQLYQKQHAGISRTFGLVAGMTSLMCLVLSLLYYGNKSLPYSYMFLAYVLLTTTALIWMVMLYLGAVKDYRSIVSSYVIGSAVGVMMGFVLMIFPLPFAELREASNLLLAYLFGMLVILSLLIRSFLRVFPCSMGLDWKFLTYLRKYPSLFFIGLFFTLGLWIDDILIWFSYLGISVYECYRFAPLYDNAVFLAYLTIMPTMILFVVNMETQFYEHYKTFYTLINGKGTLLQIEEARRQLVQLLYRQLAYVMEIQLLITLTLVVLSKVIAVNLGIAPITAEFFRIAALGAACSVFVLLIMLVLLYFEARREALLLTAVFFASSAILTSLFVPLGTTCYGLGFFMGSVISLVTGFILLRRFLADVIRFAYSSQPLFDRKETLSKRTHKLPI